MKGKDHLESPEEYWKDPIKQDLKEVECESADWIHLAQMTYLDIYI